MANKMHKEEWVDAVMSSTGGMLPAMPPDQLYKNIIAGLDKPVARIVPISVKQWAAAAILLLALNVGSVVHYAVQKEKNQAASATSMIAQQFETTYNY